MNQTEVVTLRETVDGVAIEASAAELVTPTLRAVLNEFCEQSQHWRDGYALQFGWGPFLLRKEHDTFVIVTPNYATDPFENESTDLTLALQFLTAHATIPGHAGLTPVDIRFDDDIIAVEGWQESSSLQLSRIATDTPQDSGWFIEPFPPRQGAEWLADELVRVWAWTAAQIRPAVGKVVSLPVGANAIIEGDAVRAIVDAESLEILATDILSDDRTS